MLQKLASQEVFLEYNPAMIGGTKIMARYVTNSERVIILGRMNATTNPTTPNKPVITLA